MLGKALLLSSIIALSFIGAASAEDMDTNSANAIMPGCRAMINDMEHLGGPAPHYSGIVVLKQGVCMGITTGLDSEATWSKSILKQKTFFCIPEAVTFGQKIRVVVAYIDKHPEKMREDFDWLAVLALAQAWPCKD
jgi:hypothetical protein